MANISRVNKKAYSLFEHYSQNLNLVRVHPLVELKSERNDVVVCPLCLRGFTTEDIYNKLLTPEHVPPESVGGKALALTCKTCNNNQGSELDGFLASYIKDIDALNGHGEGFVDGSWKTDDGGKVRIVFRTTETGWSVNAIPKASHPQQLDFLNKQFEQGRVERLNLTLKITNPRRAKLSLLRTAYLLAVAYMGYGFLINLNMGELRYQLQHPSEDVFPLQAIQMLDKQQIPDEMVGINIVHQPETSKSYFIVFDVQRKGSIPHRVGVHLPGPNRNDYNFFKYLKSVETEIFNFELRHYAISFEDKLKYPFLAHDIWNES